MGFEVVSRIHTILNMMRDFIAGYSSKTGNAMLVGHNGRYYEVVFHELEKPELTDKMRERYAFAKLSRSPDEFENYIITSELIKDIERRHQPVEED